MLLIEFKNLIAELKKLTLSNSVKWEKSDVSNLQYKLKSPNDRKILIDKYFGVDDNKERTMCIDLTIFDKNNEIIDEVVLCNQVDMADDFKLFFDLYTAVEEQYSKNTAPILTQITESFQREYSTH